MLLLLCCYSMRMLCRYANFREGSFSVIASKHEKTIYTPLELRLCVTSWPQQKHHQWQIGYTKIHSHKYMPSHFRKASRVQFWDSPGTRFWGKLAVERNSGMQLECAFWKFLQNTVLDYNFGTQLEYTFGGQCCRGTQFWNAGESSLERTFWGKVVLESSFGMDFLGERSWNLLLGKPGTQLEHIFGGKLVWEHSFGTRRLFVGTCPGMHFWNAFGTHFFSELALERSCGKLQ